MPAEPNVTILSYSKTKHWQRPGRNLLLMGETLMRRSILLVTAGLTLLSAALACWVFDLSVTRLGLWGIDGWWSGHPMLGIAVAVLAIGGLPHAFNIIDGYNGLAGSVALLVCLALIHVALQNGDRELAVWLVCLCGATAGWNMWRRWPHAVSRAVGAGCCPRAGRSPPLTRVRNVRSRPG